MRRFLAAISILVAMSGPSRAAEFKVTREDLARVVTVSGTIVDGDSTKFIDLLQRTLRDGYVSRVVLQSDGGRVGEGHVMARVIRALELDTEVLAGGECASACAELFFAGRNLYAGSGAKVSGHRLSIDGKESRMTDHLNRKYAEFMRDFGAPADVVRKIMSTPPSKLYVLTQRDFDELGVVAK